MNNTAPRLELIENKQTTEVTVDYKKYILFGIVSLSIILASYLSYQWFIYEKTHISTDNAYVEGDLMPVNCRIMGYVKTVLVTEGQKVKKGDTLLTFDDSDLQIELKFKQAKFKKAQADLKRARQLLKSSALSHADMESAETLFTVAQADLNATQLKIQFTKVVASDDGYIGKLSVEPGQFVQPGQSLFVIVDLKNIWIKANFKETQLVKINSGQLVEIRVDAYPGEVWQGRVETIYPSSGARLSLLPPENATGNFTKIVQRIPIKISVKQNQNIHHLRVGMSVVPTIIVGK